MLGKSALRGIFLVSALALSLSCAKKQKTDTTTTPDGGAASDAAVDSTPMSFDASGSDSGKIDGLTTIYFGYDRSVLTADAKKTIQENVAWMKKNPSVSVQIEGHCDARGSIEYNLALGEQRANAVKSYMNSLGIPASRLSTLSLGKEKPLVDGDTEEAYAKNRRANFVPAQ